MKDDIRPKLRAIVTKADEENRAQFQQSIDSILAAGLHSYKSLVVAVQSPKTDANLRNTICWVLGRLGNEAATKILLKLLTEEDDLALCRQAAVSISIIGSTTATLPLIKIMKEDTSADKREIAAYALCFLTDEQAVPALVEVLENLEEVPAVRGQAAEALADVSDAQVVTALINALNDTNVEVRFWSAFALGQTGDPQALPALEHLAATDNAEMPGWWSVSKEATDAIESIKAERQ